MQVAYCALHYGTDYLAWAVRSVQDAVQEVHVFYVSEPSYGHSNGATCPDGREALHREAYRFAKRLIWHDCPQFSSEGEHRGYAVGTLRALGAEQVLVVDADEVWIPGEAERAIHEATRANRARSWGASFVHFYRSTKYAVSDHFLPIRVLDLRHDGGEEPLSAGPVLHFGYAQRLELMRYKWTCHGHQSELRPGWIDRFGAWSPEQEDIHPVVIDLWKRAERVSPSMDAIVSSVLEGHPYLGQQVI